MDGLQSVAARGSMKKLLRPPVWGKLWLIEKQSKPYGDLKMSYHLKTASVMKTLGSILFILFLGVAVAGAQEAKPVYKVYVDGLSCPFCTYGIEKKFSKVEGVEKIDIDLKTGTTIITMATGKTLDEPYSFCRFSGVNPEATGRGFGRLIDQTLALVETNRFNSHTGFFCNFANGHGLHNSLHKKYTLRTIVRSQGLK